MGGYISRWWLGSEEGGTATKQDPDEANPTPDQATETDLFSRLDPQAELAPEPCPKEDPFQGMLLGCA